MISFYDEPRLARNALSRFRRTDAGLAQLKGLTALQKLNLRNCPEVGDAGLGQLKGLTALQDLDLQWTQVGDDSLATLKGFTALRRLDLRFTFVSPEGLAKLRKALPGCRIAATN